MFSVEKPALCSAFNCFLWENIWGNNALTLSPEAGGDLPAASSSCSIVYIQSLFLSHTWHLDVMKVYSMAMETFRLAAAEANLEPESTNTENGSVTPTPVMCKLPETQKYVITMCSTVTRKKNPERTYCKTWRQKVLIQLKSCFNIRRKG